MLFQAFKKLWKNFGLFNEAFATLCNQFLNREGSFERKICFQNLLSKFAFKIRFKIHHWNFTEDPVNDLVWRVKNKSFLRFLNESVPARTCARTRCVYYSIAERTRANVCVYVYRFRVHGGAASFSLSLSLSLSLPHSSCFYLRCSCTRYYVSHCSRCLSANSTSA